MATGHRLSRTRIRAGAAEGPNFAGRYSIVVWGCGSSCGSMGLLRYPDDPGGRANPLAVRLLRTLPAQSR